MGEDKDGYTCVHRDSTPVRRFGKHMIKSTLKEVERQQYLYKGCQRTFTGAPATPFLKLNKETSFNNKKQPLKKRLTTTLVELGFGLTIRGPNLIITH